MGEDQWQQQCLRKTGNSRHGKSGPCPDFSPCESNIWVTTGQSSSISYTFPERRGFTAYIHPTLKKIIWVAFSGMQEGQTTLAPPGLPLSRATPCSSDSVEYKKVSLILLNSSHCPIQVFGVGLRLPSCFNQCFWGPRPQCSQHSLNLIWPCWNKAKFLSAGRSQSNRGSTVARHWNRTYSLYTYK